MYYNEIHKGGKYIMAISVRLNPQDEKLFRSYAKTNNISPVSNG